MAIALFQQLQSSVGLLKDDERLGLSIHSMVLTHNEEPIVVEVCQEISGRGDELLRGHAGGVQSREKRSLHVATLNE